LFVNVHKLLTLLSLLYLINCVLSVSNKEYDDNDDDDDDHHHHHHQRIETVAFLFRGHDEWRHPSKRMILKCAMSSMVWQSNRISQGYKARLGVTNSLQGS